MILWARQRRLLLLGGVVVVLGAGALGLGATTVSLPAIIGSSTTLPVASFLTLLWAVALAEGLGSATQAVEARPASRVALLDTALLLAGTVLAALVFVALGRTVEPTLASVAHVLVMSGLAASLTLRLGPAPAVLACSTLLVATAPYGPDAPAGAYVRLVQPDGDVVFSLAVGVVLCAAAAALLLTRRVTVRLGRDAGLGAG